MKLSKTLTAKLSEQKNLDPHGNQYWVPRYKGKYYLELASRNYLKTCEYAKKKNFNCEVVFIEINEVIIDG